MIVGRPSLREVFPEDVSIELPDDPPPWYVQAFSGFAAWLSATLMLLFLGIAGLIDNGGMAVFAGLGIGVAASFARHTDLARGSTYWSQFLLASMVAGEGLAIFGAIDIVDDEAGALLCGALVFTGGLFAFPDPLHRFLATVAAGTMFGGFAMEVGPGVPLHMGATPLLAAGGALFLYEPRLVGHPWAAMRAPVAYGAVVGAFLLIMLAVWGPDDQRAFVFVTTLGLTGLTAFGLVSSGLIELEIEDPRVAAVVVATTGALGLLTWSTPGVMAALATLLLAFHRRIPPLFWLGAAFLVVFLTWFYYDLAMTLWVKAGVLVGSGALLLAARGLLVRAPEGA